MGLITCPACGGTVSYDAFSCPHCGKPHPGKVEVQPEDDVIHKYFMIISAILLTLAFIAIALE